MVRRGAEAGLLKEAGPDELRRRYGLRSVALDDGASGGEVVLFFGIIDLLQEWTLAKTVGGNDFRVVDSCNVEPESVPAASSWLGHVRSCPLVSLRHDLHTALEQYQHVLFDSGCKGLPADRDLGVFGREGVGGCLRMLVRDASVPLACGTSG
jgi:hypothetical protein